MLIEGFVPGREYAIEGLMVGGRLHALAIFDKPDPLDGPFFEETIYVTPSRGRRTAHRRDRRRVARRAPRDWPDHGPVHAECRVHGEPRRRAGSGGAIDRRALRAGAAFTRDMGATIPFEELLLRHALGEW